MCVFECRGDKNRRQKNVVDITQPSTAPGHLVNNTYFPNNGL